MYAIVDIAGQQLKVEKDQELFVHRLEGSEGDKLSFDQVMLVDENGKTTVGSPSIDGASVNAEIINHLKGDKVIVFRKKRRKGFVKKNGHRQALSQIKITGINLK
ncbi:MAG: 50S ribosomal protein L21 [Luteibaculum sp.]